MVVADTATPATAASMSPDAARFVAWIAGRAPSVHNTQPWSFRYDGDSLELRADLSRQLPASDPAGRQLLISCGAALYGAKLAVRHLGYQPRVRLWPDVHDVLLLARMSLGPAVPAWPSHHRLLRAVSRRHTSRGAFTERPLPAALLAGLQRDAEAHGAHLLLIERPGDRQRLASITAEADTAYHHNRALLAELAAWTPPADSGRRDGVPARAYPSAPPTARLGELPMRDFALGRRQGRPSLVSPSPAPVVALLTTAEDTPRSWLAAGQALHHVLLAAADQWVFATLHSQPLELPRLRTVLRRQLGINDYPQMLLSLGHTFVAATTPRRSIDQLLIEDQASVSATLRRQPA